MNYAVYVYIPNVADSGWVVGFTESRKEAFEMLRLALGENKRLRGLVSYRGE